VSEVVWLEYVIVELAISVAREAHRFPHALSAAIVTTERGIHRVAMHRLVGMDRALEHELLAVVRQRRLDDLNGQRRQRHHHRLAVFHALGRDDHVRVLAVEVDNLGDVERPHLIRAPSGGERELEEQPNVEREAAELITIEQVPECFDLVGGHRAVATRLFFERLKGRARVGCHVALPGIRRPSEQAAQGPAHMPRVADARLAECTGLDVIFQLRDILP
jgi:hypothetical protein